jgi:Outer membrane protein beta-barrel domain
MKRLVLALGISVASLSAFAQQAFDGFNVQLGIGAAQSQVKATNTEDLSLEPSPNLNKTTSATSFNGIVSAGYSQSFDNLFKGFNLAGNIFYVIGNQSGGNSSNTATDTFGTPITETLTGKYKLQNTWGISIEPGYYFSKDILGYLKFAYVSSTLNSSFTCSADDNQCLSPGGSRGENAAFSTNQTINGIGYGIGGKYQITKNIYGALDFMYVDYSKVNQTLTWYSSAFSTNAGFKPQQYMGFLSVGYKF